ncbi:signal peptidase II [Sulfurospirillum deleyianum]|uniref:Lipoprotein signal peptidase n=1 Tax=Sulfurospirillum deleyianum (strain ATCC 51133 / DSM 6946 / 5175) TaxID=525898 RepID=D1AYX9_SULD5|nr:signal peptidase II [Sulfurospirillum deleyianum]ACZ11117.1 lipoprotein signal peptidase [Sulfurospirillum deleyianum DSM 6946]
MNRQILTLFISLCAIFVIDQGIKNLFLEGFRWQGDFFSLILTYNKGVAFSMFSFLDAYLKYIQLCLVGGLGVYLLFQKEVLYQYALPIGIIAGAAFSNIYDRFLHEGVVDYFFWHYGFEFAVFNFADVMIDLGVVIILWRSWRKPNVSPK